MNISGLLRFGLEVLGKSLKYCLNLSVINCKVSFPDIIQRVMFKSGSENL